ncbi:MAG: DUF1559 domain-containing protein [Pirellulales bacterium]
MKRIFRDHARVHGSKSYSHKRAAFTLVELLVVIAIIGILVALLLPAIQAAREAARRTSCQNNAKNIALAVLNYESSKNALPAGSTLALTPTGTTYNQASGLAWTVVILPYIEEAKVSEDALRIWDNMKKAPPGQDAYSSTMDSINKLLLPMYLCSSDEGLKYQIEKYGNADRRAMSYCGVAGSYYARTGDCVKAAVNNSWKLPGRYCISADMTGLGPVNFDGLLIQGWQVGLKSISDGTSKTLLFGERTYQVRTWMIGAFALASPSDPGGTARTSAVPDGPQPSSALFATKNVTDLWPINHDPFVACYVGHDNKAGDRPEVPDSTPRKITCNDLPFGSQHKGGANFAMGDGSVHFLVDNLDSKVYLGLGSRNGEEAVGDF